MRCRLRIVRRHKASCKDPATGSRLSEDIDCSSRLPAHKKCLLWVRGTVNGERVQVALKTRSLTAAIQMVNDKLDAQDSIGRGVLVSAAVDAYLAEKAKERLPDGATLTRAEAVAKSDTIRKHNDLLRQLETFCTKEGVRFLRDINKGHLIAFRDTWQGRVDHATGERQPKTALGRQKYQETLRAFFKYCVREDLLTKSPALALSSPTVPRSKIRTPIPAEKISSLLEAVTAVFPKIWREVRAFLLVMASTGLRLGDVVSLEINSVDGERVLVDDMDKTGDPLYTRLSPEAVEALAAIKPKSERYYFWTGRGKLDTGKADWSAKLLKLYRKVGVDQRSHAFRDTLVAGVLDSEGSLETAGALLGHRNTKITKKYYEHWSSKRQKVLNANLAAAWAKLGLAAPMPKTNALPEDMLVLLEKVCQQGKGEALKTILSALAG